jgi:hypothetical protein
LAVADDASFVVAIHSDTLCLVDTSNGRVRSRIEPVC